MRRSTYVKSKSSDPYREKATAVILWLSAISIMESAFILWSLSS